MLLASKASQRQQQQQPRRSSQSLSPWQKLEEQQQLRERLKEKLEQQKKLEELQAEHDREERQRQLRQQLDLRQKQKEKEKQQQQQPQQLEQVHYQQQQTQEQPPPSPQQQQQLQQLQQLQQQQPPVQPQQVRTEEPSHAYASRATAVAASAAFARNDGVVVPATIQSSGSTKQHEQQQYQPVTVLREEELYEVEEEEDEEEGTEPVTMATFVTNRLGRTLLRNGGKLFSRDLFLQNRADSQQPRKFAARVQTFSSTLTEQTESSRNGIDNGDGKGTENSLFARRRRNSRLRQFFSSMKSALSREQEFPPATSTKTTETVHAATVNEERSNKALSNSILDKYNPIDESSASKLSNDRAFTGKGSGDYSLHGNEPPQATATTATSAKTSNIFPSSTRQPSAPSSSRTGDTFPTAFAFPRKRTPEIPQVNGARKESAESSASSFSFNPDSIAVSDADRDALLHGIGNNFYYAFTDKDGRHPMKSEANVTIRTPEGPVFADDINRKLGAMPQQPTAMKPRSITVPLSERNESKVPIQIVDAVVVEESNNTRAKNRTGYDENEEDSVSTKTTTVVRFHDKQSRTTAETSTSFDYATTTKSIATSETRVGGTRITASSPPRLTAAARFVTALQRAFVHSDSSKATGAIASGSLSSRYHGGPDGFECYFDNTTDAGLDGLADYYFAKYVVGGGNVPVW